MSKSADCERAAVVREAAVCSALRPQPDAATEGNLENSGGRNTSICHRDVFAPH